MNVRIGLLVSLFALNGLLAASAEAQDFRLIEWRDLRRGITSPWVLAQRTDVRKDLGLTASQVREMADIERRWNADNPMSKLANRGYWSGHTTETELGTALLSRLPFRQRARLQSLQYQALGALALLEPSLQARLRLTKSQGDRLLALEQAYVAEPPPGANGPIMNDPPPFDERPRPVARKAFDTRLIALLTPGQRRAYVAARGKTLPSLRAITPFTG